MARMRDINSQPLRLIYTTISIKVDDYVLLEIPTEIPFQSKPAHKFFRY